MDATEMGKKLYHLLRMNQIEKSPSISRWRRETNPRLLFGGGGEGPEALHKSKKAGFAFLENKKWTIS